MDKAVAEADSRCYTSERRNKSRCVKADYIEFKAPGENLHRIPMARVGGENRQR